MKNAERHPCIIYVRLFKGNFGGLYSTAIDPYLTIENYYNTYILCHTIAKSSVVGVFITKYKTFKEHCNGNSGNKI